MKTTRTKILFISMLFSAAVPSLLFSAEEYTTDIPALTDELDELGLTDLSMEKTSKKAKNTGSLNKSGESALTHAVLMGSSKYIEGLLFTMGEKGKVNDQNIAGDTPLLVLLKHIQNPIKKSDLKIAKLLLKANADINYANNSGDTPLKVAQGRNLSDVLKLFGVSETGDE